MLRINEKLARGHGSVIYSPYGMVEGHDAIMPPPGGGGGGGRTRNRFGINNAVDRSDL
jgi:hypothetical protein